MMNSRDRRLIILQQLGQESEPITLSELTHKLGLNYTDRTIRRCLNELVHEGLIRKSGHTKGVKYVAIKASNRLSGLETSNLSQISSCFGSESLTAIEKVSKPLFERQPVTYSEEWVQSYEPNTSFYLPNYIRQKLYNMGRRMSNQDPAGTYAHQIFNRLLIDLSYNSSRLEGNTYSLLDTERLLLHGDSPEGKLDEEKVMILNHKEAIRYLVVNASHLEVSQNVICTLHFLLADGLVEARYAGKVRDHGVRIGGSTYIPFEDPRRLQKLLEIIAKKAAMIVDPFEQSFFLLVHVCYLQAFADVNKRTARLAANISLIRGNLVPLAFSDVEVKDYMSAMIAVYELQDVRPLIDLYVYSYMRTCAAYDSTVKALGFDEVRVRYRLQRRELLREIIQQKYVGEKMRSLIFREAKKRIPKGDQQSFIDDTLEDLQQMDESRMVGLGVTLEELMEWLQLYRTQ